MDTRKILMIHYSVFEQTRWGRIHPLSVALAKNGADVTILTTSPLCRHWKLWSTTYKDGIRIVQVNDIAPRWAKDRGLGLVGLIARILYCAVRKYDYVYTDCAELPAAGIPAKFCQIVRGAIFMSEMGDLLGKGGYYEKKPFIFRLTFGWFYLWCVNYFRRSADIVVALSSFMEKLLIEQQIDARRIIIVKGGSFLEAFEGSRLNKSPRYAGILTLGYLGMDEGEIADLIPFIDGIREANLHNQVKIITSGRQLSANTVKAHKLNDILVQLGWIDFESEIRKLDDIEVFLLLKRPASIKRSLVAWPNKFGDYLALGRAVLVSPYGDIEQFVNKHPDGCFILHGWDTRSIKTALENILDSRERLGQMGQYNRSIAREKTSWDSRVSKWNDILVERGYPSLWPCRRR